MKPKLLSFAAAVCLFLVACTSTQKEERQEQPKPRVIVTCDPELDDNNSLIRFLLFSTDFDVQGLIYASSRFHWKGDGKGTTQYIPGREYSSNGRDLGPQTSWRWAESERFIDDLVEAYASVYPNLKVHNPNYPIPQDLKSKIYVGNVEFEGDISHDSPGSDRIKEILLDDDPRPVFIQVWGGPSTASRALKSIEEEYKDTPEWESIKAKVSAKAKFCLSGLQDLSFQEYVQPNWPEVESVLLNAGVASLGYGAKRSVAGTKDTLYFSSAWTLENVKSKGVFGEHYRVWGDGRQMAPGDFTDYFGEKGYTADELREMGYWVWTPPQQEGNFISEGDTPMYLNLIGNGLRAHEGQEYGGWAGRKKELSEEEKAAGYTAPYAMRREKDEVLPDFLPAIQNSFAARLNWSVTSEYDDANHEPIIEGPLEMSATAGSTVKLNITVSDPDNDAVSTNWMQFKVGSYKGDVSFAGITDATTSVTIPADAKAGETIHLVLQVVDDGSLALTKYLRTVITVL
ncbi:DUF1593 domain-containing protein [Draconibacterium sp. IB214405]|uniref:DUF1593 domain-containing protein n=1 Tax=Draconibacterium sp. IB214405 TaxID=3097352 RepID=UPI002A0ACBD2|nr:nucleoside hydrolase-like domain-containing protein [Draconibacterium sp. IB214405]MDX8339772.1 DUF1593 domain-containing protein [Draconibacterium sp. IB214405]